MTTDPHAPLRERLSQLYEECESNFFGAWDSTAITDAIAALKPVAPAPHAKGLSDIATIEAEFKRHLAAAILVGVLNDTDAVYIAELLASLVPGFINSSQSAPPTTGAEVGKLPKEPPPGLLMSMAIRYDHALGFHGYYDSGFFAEEGVTHQQRLESTLTQMRQIYEEVAGYGFYSPEREAEYRALTNPVPQGAKEGGK